MAFKQLKSKAQEFADKMRNTVLDEIRGSAEISNANGTHQLSVFSQIVGNLPKWATNQKSVPGQLPNPESFKVTGIKFTVVADNGKPVRFMDAFDVLSKATFVFSVSQIPYLEGWVASHIPSNVIVPIDGKPEQTVCTNLSAYVNLSARPIAIAPQKAFDLAVEVINQNMAVAPSDYASLYGKLYLTCTLYGIREKAIA